jgi:hypothetical protein
MKIYRNTLTPVRAKKLVNLARSMNIEDATYAKNGQSRMHQSARFGSDGMQIRFSIYCTDAQYAKFSALYAPQA